MDPEVKRSELRLSLGCVRDGSLHVSMTAHLLAYCCCYYNIVVQLKQHVLVY